MIAAGAGPASADLPVINMLWIGGSLGYLEQLSIVSFLVAGHRVRIHAYESVGELPIGAELVDAGLIADRDTMLSLRHKRTGSYALASDYFRLLLQQQEQGLWADADMVALEPFRVGGANVFGFEAAGQLNSAVLRLPADSPILRDLLEHFRANAVPWWVTPARKRQMAIKRFLRIPFGPQNHSWGVYGPRGLTALAGKYSLLAEAQPVEVFYPVPYAKARKLFEPGSSVEDYLGPGTLGVHLWNNALDGLRNTPPGQDTAIGQLLRRFGL